MIVIAVPMSCRDKAQAQLARLEAQLKGAEVQADASLANNKQLQQKLSDQDAEAQQLRHDR